MSTHKKLVGWKAIAAYFSRDRNTVARWARERGLPVHVIPGGKQRSVFAFENELRDWATRNFGNDTTADEAAAPAIPLVPAPVPPRPESTGSLSPEKPRLPARILARLRALGPGRRVLGVGVALCVIGAASLFAMGGGAEAPRSAFPQGAQASADFIAARDAWARRTPADLDRAIQLYEKVIRAEPGFAPARAGLAEAWLIRREYGAVTDARAYGAARIAAQKAISLDPGLPSAHRALGFIDYWWDNDPAGAVSAFQRALALDDRDGQTHFWFANILADLGQDQAAERHYAQARLLSPGSVPIAIEHACAQWQAGRDQRALQLLEALRAQHPADPTIRNCLSWVHIGLGDMAGAAQAYRELAALRREPDLLALSARLDAAVEQDPATAHRVLIEDARREIALGTRRIREVPAFYASAVGDRTEMLDLLHEAVLLGERWYSHSVTRRMEAKWRHDAEVTRLLRQLRTPPPRLGPL
ncbi:hypothetical protein SLG_07210 [Sphingobium sp. SYK-6]|uniref:tetratricopeptide repeat protein n=1 Tax=Sphingobium sp. (strain NBRC 103272 / SYK-6) TaxID=627192 RepID=UPI0002276A36|nr:tetratricopeptide repeat protein [Sphingobium sp. SYK-6]BAK65396.1 hypothetical protein SLG_07210 [Sphingobium sp. SYK-6]